MKIFNRAPTLFAADSDSFKKQEAIFVVLNLFVLAALLLIHTILASHFGNPPKSLVLLLAGGFLLNVVELVWIQGRAKPLSDQTMFALTWSSITVSMALAIVLASLSYRQDAQYFALMIVPILQAAFRLSFAVTSGVVLAACALAFFWVWAYFRLHPPPDLNEYFEAGTISLIYAILGPLVWLLVDHLRERETMLTQSITDLEQAEKRLRMEEKLAAVGRFSSAIAHEIRNPVAMISSALSTAIRGGLEEEQRLEMFEIAAAEASRLEKLTGDFLCYARPREPNKEPSDLQALLQYVASVCRIRAAESAVAVELELADALEADIDPDQTQQALFNIVINAVEASPARGIVGIRAGNDRGWLRIDVDNANGPIPPDAVDLIFEPFFTTKAKGTGLGLAIARNIARAQGGDLVLSDNETGLVRFSMTLPARSRRRG